MTDWDRERLRRISRTPMFALTDEDVAYMEAFMEASSDEVVEAVLG